MNHEAIAELLSEVKSVLSSINRGRHHKVEIEGDEPAYWQREEWITWAVGEVLPRVDAALADHIGEANEKAQPQPAAVADLLREALPQLRIGGGYARNYELCQRIEAALSDHFPGAGKMVFDPRAGGRVADYNCGWNACRAAMTDALAADHPERLLAMVPKGWRLVPETLTDSMIKHGEEMALIQRYEGCAGHLANLDQVWDVLLCSAPALVEGGDAHALLAERDELRAVIKAIIAEIPHRARYAHNGNAPGHAHRVPGIWDSDNGPLAGKECGWCKAWNAALALDAKGEV